MQEVIDREELPADAEMLFGLSGVGLERGEVWRDGDDMDYFQQLEELIDDAVDHEESYLSGKRERNMSYYNGDEPALPGSDEDEESKPNRSTFISTDVRDTVLTILPSLVRIFMSSERIANFIPTTEADQPRADQAYDYCNYVFYKDNPGFLILYGALKDALIVKAGIITWWTDVSYETTEQEYTNITEDQLMYLLSETPDAEVAELEGGEGGIISYLLLRYQVPKPLIKMEGVPPEEFRISKTAKDSRTARLIGREWIATPSDLIKRGIPMEAIEEVGFENQLTYSDERYLRNPALADSSFTSRGILTGEYFVRIDKDGDGIDELRHIITLGSTHLVVVDKAIPKARIALFGCDPVSHTAIGDCVADLTLDIQKFKTNMIRGQMDNLAEIINPRMVINELVTNLEDALSDEVGAIIRTRTDPGAAVAYTRPIYAGAEVQESVNYMDQVRASRTGVTEASKGLDPKALQSTALSGIDAIVSGAQERIELIARVLAETGWKDLLEGILTEVTNNPSVPRTMKLRGKWDEVVPSVFDANMTIEVNPTLGKGSDMTKLQALMDIREQQMNIITKFGIANPIVTPENYMNTVQDMAELANIKNFNRYFNPVTPELIQSIQNTPAEPDPATVLAQAELEKTKSATLKIIADTDKAQQKTIFDATKLKVDDDFRRDQLNINAMLESAALFGQAMSDVSSSDGILALNQPPEA